MLTMDSPKLRELSRAQLQSLAKREAIRAVGKTKDIIGRLMRKHPQGVPVPGDGDDPSASSAPPKRILSKISRKATPSSAPVTPTPQIRTDPKGTRKGKQIAETTSPSPSSSLETLRLLYPEYEQVAGPSNANAQTDNVSMSHPQVPEHPPAASAPAQEYPHRGTSNENQNAENPSNWQGDDDDDDKDPTGAPTRWMVVDALRQCTTLVDAAPAIKTSIAETTMLVQRAECQLDKVTPDARELAVTREYLETFLLGRMKRKPELWDGTGKMAKPDRKVRMTRLRATRKLECEKKWREANEINRQHRLSLEPFSAFAIGSDEDVIESLQTTPASSKSGSPKRAREESGNGSDTDSGVGESRRKRART